MKILLFIFLFACSSASLLSEFKQTNYENSPDPEAIHFETDDGHHLFHGILMENITPSEAARLFHHRSDYLKGFFKNDEDPYFGKTMRWKKCLQELNLKGIKQVFGQFETWRFDLPVTDNFILGQCNPELETFHGTFIFLYCFETGSFHELKYYRPKKSPTKLPENFGGFCAKK